MTSSLLARPLVKAKWLGRLAYGDALTLQKAKVAAILNSKQNGECVENEVWLLEHLPVYTVGIRSHVYTDDEEKRLRILGAEFYRTNRGGLITFHGPGQLVVYPLLDLAVLKVDDRSVGIRRYVHLIETTIIQLLIDQFGLHGYKSPHTGVWLDEGTRKIAAIGVNVRRGVTSHGLALNCNTDLNWFDQIVPCGIEGKPMTSLSRELDTDIGIRDTVKPFCRAFQHVFQCRIEYDDSIDEYV